MYDVIHTKCPRGQNADNLNLIRHTISFQKVIVFKIPQEGGGDPYVGSRTIMFENDPFDKDKM